MLSPKLKSMLSQRVQDLLQSVRVYDENDELPDGEISFILNVDRAEGWSWANIRNESDKDVPVPSSLVRNLSV